MKPLCIDLCCGLGGWARGFIAEGYHVIGFDLVALPYPGELVLQDIRTLDGKQLTGARVIVASPPCEEFSRHQMPWTRKRNPPEPDLSIVEAAWRIHRESGVPMILENVRMAQEWIGPAKWHGGSFYLWGDVPRIMPKVLHRPKESMSSTRRLERAMVPLVISQHIANAYF